MASKKVVRVNFMDDAIKSFALEESGTAEQLRAQVVERLGLKEDSCFALFERKEKWERCLEPEEKPVELMTLWSVEPAKKKTEKVDNNNAADNGPSFVFKKKIFLREDDREMGDSVAKHLVYIQALSAVIKSEYPVPSAEDAIRLAGLQVQIIYADHKPGSHAVGFLTQKIREFVPKDLFGKKTATDWETLIFKAHANNAGKTPDDCKTEYLEIVKQWPFYGTTFYPPCKTVTKAKLPAKVIIGVNAEGILLLKKEKDKELISTHPFTEICSWASSSTTFAFEFGSQTESVKYSFETKQGAIIASCIQTYIDILVQMLKGGVSDSVESSHD